MSKPLPEYTGDLFSRESVRNARAVDDQLREFAPVVKIPQENVTMLARFEHVAEGLKDWRTFSSTSRPWHDPNSVRPELLLTDDPPKHSRVRAVIGNALSPKALSKMAEAFKTDADAIVKRLRDRDGQVVDAVTEITQAFVYKVLPDLLGLPLEGRENMHAFGNMVWATMGPSNELFNEAMQNTGPVAEMFLAADRGEVTEDEAGLLVGIMLSAAADTTVITMANAIRAFSEFPDQYRLLRSDPGLIRAAFEESLRWDSPSRMAGRIATRDVEIDGYLIPKGERCGLMFAAANRDPRKWQDPDRFDIRRNNAGHVGFGLGVHACVGRVLALLEADALLGAVVREIESFEPAGKVDMWMTTIGHGPERLPVKVNFA